jgi:DNA repair exonuclease SbcCD ATPase subunit
MLVQQQQADEQVSSFVMSGADETVAEEAAQAEQQVAERAEVKEEPKEDSFQMSKRFHQLQKKEAAIQKKMAEIQEARKQVEEFNQFKSQAKLNPLKALEALGLTYEEITDFVANGYEPSPDQKYKELEERLERKLKEKDDQEAKRKELEVENQVKRYKESLYAHIQAKSEEYELINLEGEHESVWELMDAWYTKHNEILDWDKAATMVEEHLEEQLKERLSKAKKLQNLVGQPKQVSGKPNASTPKTISSSSMLSGSSSPNKSKLSDEESLELAAQLIKWE